MNTNRLLVAMVSAAIAAGCTATMVTHPGSATPVPNAPVNETTRPGVVKYLNEGSSSVRRKRRADAYKKMAAACGGAYRIDSEGSSVTGGVVVPVGTAAVASTSESWYIQFSCVRESSAKP